MIYWSFISLSVALASGLFGFGGSGTEGAWLGQALFFVFLAFAALLVALKFARDDEVPPAEEAGGPDLPDLGESRPSRQGGGTAGRAAR